MWKIILLILLGSFFLYKDFVVTTAHLEYDQNNNLINFKIIDSKNRIEDNIVYSYNGNKIICIESNKDGTIQFNYNEI